MDFPGNGCSKRNGIDTHTAPTEQRVQRERADHAAAPGPDRHYRR